MSKVAPVNALSFDVEEYYHALNFRAVVKARPEILTQSRVEIGTDRILEILSRGSVQATFFILGEVARAHPALVRRIVEEGHEVASHGMSHRTVHELGREKFRQELRDSKALLEDMAGAPVQGFRASTFSITRTSLWALDILLEEGYGYDSSIFPVRHDRYGVPEFPTHPVQVRESGDHGVLLEFPPLTLPLMGMNLPCGGGGYFRLYPPALFHHALRRANRSGLPAVLYLHPWEFDPDQPRHGLGGLKTFRHYLNIGKTGMRLERMVTRFSFSTLGALAAREEPWPVHHFGVSS
jgi:polysaccharide deacetylase family protein (PEP-CTERM system associated)